MPVRYTIIVHDMMCTPCSSQTVEVYNTPSVPPFPKTLPIFFIHTNSNKPLSQPFPSLESNTKLKKLFLECLRTVALSTVSFTKMRSHFLVTLFAGNFQVRISTFQILYLLSIYLVNSYVIQTNKMYSF